jgi:hypothetical protein
MDHSMHSQKEREGDDIGGGGTTMYAFIILLVGKKIKIRKHVIRWRH